MLYAGIAGSLLVGVLLSLLGGGGSILTVPLLVYVLDVEPRTAIAMSLVVVGVTSASGAVLHARAGRVHWRIALLFGAGGMGGAFLGGQLNPYLAPDVLLILFAAVMVAAAVAMLRRREAEALPGSVPVLPVPRVLAQGATVGALSGLVGAGGGFLIVPALTLAGLPTPAAAATSLVVIALQCAAGLTGHLSHLDLPWVLTGEILLAAMAGSVLGGRLAGRVPPAMLRKGFAVFVLATACFLMAAQTPAPLRERVLTEAPWLWSMVFLAMLIPVTAWWRLRAARPQQASARAHPQ